MKQKLTALALALALTWTLSLAPPASAAADALPRMGDVLHGFAVTGRDTLDLTGAPTVTLTHTQSGATLYYVASQDLNRTFGVSFRTPALDARGMSHILEHCALSGGEKYPCPNLFFTAANQTYHTFANAMTGETATTYPVSSLSEDQLLKLADLYLDGIFHPMLLTDKRVFDREAWRYDLADPDGPITLTGTVYNEMKGAMGLTRTALNNGVKTLFPGTILGNNSGGQPEVIPSLTHEALLSYHNTYYHPSNALFFLNGKLELSRFLAFLDGEYLSGFEKTDVDADLGAAAPLIAPAFARYEYPVEQGTPAANGAVVTYGMAAPGATRDEGIALSLLTDLLSEDTSPVCRAVTDVLPGAQVRAYVSLEFAQPFVMFHAEGVDEGDAGVFRDAVDHGLADFARSGPGEGAASAAAGSALLSYRLLSESAQFGPSLLSIMAERFFTGGRLDCLNRYGEVLTRVQADDDGRWLASVAQTYLVGNPWSALAVTVPIPGLRERKDAEQARTLAERKAALTDEEVAAMAENTADFNAWSAQEPAAKDVAALTAVSVKTLPEDLRKYKVVDRTRSGVRSLTAETETDALGAALVALDLSALPTGDLHWAQLYSSLVGKLGTDVHTAAELSALIPRTLGQFRAYTAALPESAQVYSSYAAVQWVGGTEDIQGALDLAAELLFRTDLTDVSALRQQVAALRAEQKSRLCSDPSSVQALRAQALLAPEKYAAHSYMTGLDFYEFLSEVETRLTLNPAQVTARLIAVQTALTNRHNAVTQFAGSREAVAGWNKAAAAFWKTVPLSKTVPADRTSIPSPNHAEGVAAEVNVQYNLLAAPLSALGLRDSGKLDVVAAILNDRYLTPQTRHIIGAYGSAVRADENGLTLSTYRDPALGKTYEVFAAAPDALASLSLTQEELDGYIMSCYAALTRPQGDLTGAMDAMRLHLMGRDSGDTRKRMREMKTVKLSDVHDLAAALRALNKTGFRSTVGGAAILEENAERFDAILYPNGQPGPDAAITRESLALRLYREAGSPIGARAPVTDLVRVSPQAREAVLWAVATGAVPTDGEGYFHPHREVSKTWGIKT